MAAACSDPRAMDALVSQVGRKIGLSVATSRRRAVASAIQRVMERRGIDDGARFVNRIGRDETLADEIVAEVTVGETYFFREPAQFNVMRTLVLPSLMRDRPAGHPIRIWSAGCSTGEEPYSLAILMEEEGLAERASIIATDISRDALREARRAEYGKWSLRDGDAHRLERYFCQREDRFRLERRLARRVNFHRHCLGSDELPSIAEGMAEFDLILCRNVLIYLETATVRRVAAQLFNCLAQGGWLVPGPSDPPVWEYAPFETVITPAGVICRRGVTARNGRRRS